MKAMSPVIPDKNFPEIKIAENQDEYETLPAIVNVEEQSVLFRFQLSDEEKAQIAETGDLYVTLWTFGEPMQPILIQTVCPKLALPEENKYQKFSAFDKDEILDAIKDMNSITFTVNAESCNALQQIISSSELPKVKSVEIISIPNQNTDIILWFDDVEMRIYMNQKR